MTTDQRQKIISVGLDATGIKQGVAEGKAAVSDLSNAVVAEGERASKGIEKVGTGSESASKSLDKNTRSIINSIQRTAAVMEAGERGSSKYFQAIANQRGANMDALRPYLDQLDQVIAKQRQAAVGASGISSAQQAAAMRGVPAQFTDIVTSLQGGQNPMTVLLQQGGQLKDMFGGVGNAARALGGYVAGLLSPMTVLAGVAAAVGAAFYQGSKEAEDYSKALIMTGNAAGTSVNQLKNIADAISSSTSNTTGAAADALQQIVTTGGVASKNLQLVATTALAMKSATGQAIEDTVKQFSELGKEPVKASLKLTEQYGYLTAEVYKQIKALEDQGRMTDAASMAQEAFGQAMQERAKAIAGELGTLEVAWKGVIGAAKSAWDAMLGLGRESSLEQKLAEARRNLQNGSGFGGATEARAQIAVLEAQIAAQEKQNAVKEKGNALDKAKIAWSQEGDKYLSKRQQMEIEIAKARQQGIAAGASELEIQKRIADIREKMTDKKRDVDPSRSRDHNEYLSQLRKDADTELDAIKAKNQQIKAAAEAEQYLQDIRNKFTRSNESKSDSLMVLPEAVSRLRSELRVVDQTAEDAKNKLAHMFGDGKLSAEDYASKLAELNALTDDQRKAVTALNDRQNELNASWEYGAEKALQKYSDSAKNVASQTEGIFTDAFNGMADAMAQFAQTGKLNFTSLANSIIADIARAQAKMAMSGLADYLKGMFSGSAASTTGGSAGGNAGGAGSLITSANGNVFSGAPDLHQYVNTVQTSPRVFGFDTLHKFARGGVFAEAGPEAVMPLTRDSSGRLGVQATGSTSAAGVTINITNNSGAETKTSQRKDARGNSIIDILIEQVKGSIASDISTGNGAVPAAMQSSFGLNRTAGAY